MKRCIYLLSTFIFITLYCITGPAKAQVLNYFHTHTDGVAGVDGLDGTYGIIISPDDLHVYTSSSTDDAIVLFSRNPVNGGLTYVETYWDDGQPSGTIDGLQDAKRLAISPDGAHVYVPASADDAITVFSRNSATGVLTYVTTYRDGVGGVNGINGSTEVVVSPDNNHVYAVGYTDDAIAVFTRNSTTGLLTFVEAEIDGVGGVDGMNSPRSVTVSADGLFVYVASSIDDAIAVFSRNTTTGQLTFEQFYTDGVGGVDGLNGAYHVTISPDDAFLYATSSSDDAVAVFSRNPVNGLLTYIELHKDDSQGGFIANMNASRSSIISVDGSHLYTISSSDHGLTVFDRNSSNGELTFWEAHVDGLNSVDGLNGGRFMVMSHDGNSLYAVSTGDDAVLTFSNAVLGMQILNFEAKGVKGMEVALNWKSSAYLNTGTFSVERKSKSGSYEVISSFFAAGQSFDFTDMNPVSGSNLYRIVYKDESGSRTQSNVILFEHQDPFQTKFTLYPDPAKSQASLRVTIEAAANMQVSMTNLQGQYIGMLFNGKLESGVNEILIERNELPAGLYLISILQNGRHIKNLSLVFQ